MRFWVRLGMLFYVTMTFLVVLVFAVLAFNLFPFDKVVDILSVIYYDQNARLVFGALAVILVLMNHILWGLICGSQFNGKTIAFDNPSGRVTVSLLALEDLIRRLIARVPEVKEVRASITVGKKGLEVSARIVLNADVNIPEMTSNLQEMVKAKIQDTIGIEETVIVRIDVVKIVPSTKSRNKKQDRDESDTSERNTPFEGYKA